MTTEGKWKLIAAISVLLAAIAFVAVILRTRELRSLKALVAPNAHLQQEPLQVKTEREAKSRAQSSLTDVERAPVDDRTFAVRERAIAAMRSAEVKAIAAAQERYLFSPDVQNQAAQAFKAGLKLRYGRWYSAAGFSELEVAGFEQVMEERFWAMSDLIASARNNGVAERSVSEFQRQGLESSDGKLRVLLGDARYRDFLRYESSADARNVAHLITGSFYASGVPLSDGQIDRLVEVIAGNRENAPRSDDWVKAAVLLRAPGNPLSEVDWAKTEVAAAQFLSPAQISALRAQQTLVQVRKTVDNELKHIANEARRTIPTK